MKGKASTLLTVCPLRVKPDDTSEMVSQLLFGEQVQVLELYKKNWARVRLDYDEYEGWMDLKQLVSIEKNLDSQAYSLEVFENIFSDQQSTWVTLGAELSDFDGMISKMGGYTFRFSGQAIAAATLAPDRELIEKLARRLLNVPYLWGGRTPMGIDCSGFTQLVFKCSGVKILRDAKDQATQGTTIDFVNAAQSGDLAFFSKMTDNITHVGIILPNNEIIHASGKVRIDVLDHYGIFNRDIEQYTHRLKIIKRYF